MHRTPLAAVLLAAAVAIVLPASALAITLTKHVYLPHGITRADDQHRVAEWHVALDSDHDAIWNDADGCPGRSGPRANDGCPWPPEPTVSSSETPTATTTTSSYYAAPATTSSGGCPSYMSGEASSPTAVNPSSGASGCYQVTPGTAAAEGAACSDVNATSCVAAICADQGNYAWSSSGARPCDYLAEP